jgi:hypothetical protein
MFYAYEQRNATATRRWETNTERRGTCRHNADSQHQSKQGKPREAMWHDAGRTTLSAATPVAQRRKSTPYLLWMSLGETYETKLENRRQASRRRLRKENKANGSRETSCTTVVTKPAASAETKIVEMPQKYAIFCED